MIIISNSIGLFITPPGSSQLLAPPQIATLDAYFTRGPDDPCGPYACLNFVPYTGAEVSKYGIYRSIVGFEGNVVAPSALTGLTLELATNLGPTQTAHFTGSETLVAQINKTIAGGQAVASKIDPTRFIFRVDPASAPGAVQVVGGTALSLLGVAPRLITKESEHRLIKAITAKTDDDINGIEFCDPDGGLTDSYQLTTFDLDGVESDFTHYTSAQSSTGRLCNIYGTVSSVQGVRIPDAEVTVRTLGYAQSVVPSVFLDKETITVMTGADGKFKLWAVQGALVEINIDAIPLNRKVRVPDLPRVALTDLLVDRSYRFPLEVE